MIELPEIEIEEWSPVDGRGPLCGFCTARVICCGMRLHNVAIRRSDDGRYHALPSGKPRFGGDDRVLRNSDDGRVSWQPIVSFVSGAARSRFSAAVVEALVKFGALDGDAT